MHVLYVVCTPRHANPMLSLLGKKKRLYLYTERLSQRTLNVNLIPQKLFWLRQQKKPHQINIGDILMMD